MADAYEAFHKRFAVADNTAEYKARITDLIQQIHNIDQDAAQNIGTDTTFHKLENEQAMVVLLSWLLCYEPSDDCGGWDCEVFEMLETCFNELKKAYGEDD